MLEPEPVSLDYRTLAKYQVIQEIGRGNMGTVYLGHDPFIDRPVAIKVARERALRPGDDGELFRRLFFNEAQAAGLLKHPNITAIFDAGTDGDLYYIVMEYVHGGTTLEQFCHPGTLLPIKEAVAIVYRCAVALDYAHRKGVIHRDVKPRNILITDEQDVKISDFGIAVMPGDTQPGFAEHAGSPLYMSPEQIRREALTPQSDVFALGIVTFELITGRHPFAGENMSAINHRILNTEPPRLSDLRADVPPVLERVVERALAKDLAKRYHSALDLAGDLSIVFDFLHEPESALSRQAKFDASRELDFFRQFTDTELWELINASTWHHLDEGGTIIMEGEVDKAFYVVIEGSVEISKGGRFIDVLTTGDCFGEMGFVSGRRRTATVRARGRVTIMKVQAPLIERASLTCQLRFHKLFLHTLIERLSRATDRLATDPPGELRASDGAK